MTPTRWIALSLAGALALLPACGRSPGNPSTVPKAPVPIQFLHAMPSDGPQGRLISDLVAEFNGAQSEVVVTASYQGRYADLERNRGAARPEVVQLTDQMLVATHLQALDDLVPAEELGDYPYPLLQAARRDGHLYGLPFNRAAAVLIYDKARVATPPDTWEQFRQAARGATTIDGQVGALFTADANTFGQFLLQAGGFWLEDGAPAFDSQVGVEALEFIAKLVREGSARALRPGEQAADLFSRGEAAMVITSSDAIPAIRPAMPIAWGVAEVPRLDNTL